MTLATLAIACCFWFCGKRLRNDAFVLLTDTMSQLDKKTFIQINPWLLFLPAKPCPAPPGWREDGGRNGSQQEFRVGQSVRVTCPKGQQVKGSGTITCRPDQTWSLISSVCESRWKTLNIHFGKASLLHVSTTDKIPNDKWIISVSENK